MIIITLLHILFFIRGIQGLHFYIFPGDTKCFYENLNKHEQVTGDFIPISITDVQEPISREILKKLEFNLNLTIHEPFSNNELVYNNFEVAVTNFTFTALSNGEHKICVTPTITDYNKLITLEVDLSRTKNNLLNSQRFDTVDGIHYRINNLVKRLLEIKKEQKLDMLEETTRISNSESTRRKIVLFSTIQLLVIIIFFSIQLKRLKLMTIKKKIQ
ncbi:hypothetical protein Kpol_1031p20 [Vanderwaltozyma polyspora DSM 70294]|uniref:GOLD domain-containing protein n=1 Tax=Vanderwaltozyma polyspora (strain ATCC 22028 / DSM 70294 / BCRC 21397 / CBS 2163 / NBRC 10782 / NRRL Y-8283 / UCD 57-17) TaxID=436907 RepID=A7THV4_VANPO|nr:uncharacterized protein Kpol_1031p20 [Vanderwaltozyma polyspora DSM 70294]EDO18116.1 hypothetical protein Kpol_1031p20 [Vanderwaltozyma polyspora DSM 70294]